MIRRNKKTVFWTREGSYTYESTLIGATCTTPVQVQARQNPSAEEVGGSRLEFHPKLSSSWQVIAFGRGTLSFQ